jgi:hypothetical protein
MTERLRLTTICWLLSILPALAQQKINISGKIMNSQQQALSGATVFIDGSEKITSTDKVGEFLFHHFEPGTYQLVVKMIGYSPFRQNIIIQQLPVHVDIILKEAAIQLAEVKIGIDPNRDAYLKIFIDNFLGTTANAKNCTILNTELLNFTTTGNQASNDPYNINSIRILQAESDDFLIIENKSLGYRIKYLLRNFKYSYTSKVTSYDGEYMFEPMQGSVKEQSKWNENRLKTYRGSLMHYLRALYRNETQKAGFEVYQTRDVRQQYAGRPMVEFASQPLNMWHYTYQPFKDFIALQFQGRWMILYQQDERKKPFHSLKDSVSAKEYPKKASFLQLHLDEAVIDSKGKIIDYRSFLQQGYWGTMRIADQLPFEYEPPQ